MCKPRGPASGCQPCCLGLTNIRVPSCHQAHQCLTLPLCPPLPLLVQPLWQRPLSSEVITSHRCLVYILHRSLHPSRHCPVSVYYIEGKTVYTRLSSYSQQYFYLCPVSTEATDRTAMSSRHCLSTFAETVPFPCPGLC